jgi:biotin-(acetyl-CoA carboxylase) ligase
MASLRAIAGRPVARDALLAAFLERLEDRIDRLRDGAFDAAAWADRQVTTGRTVRLEQGDRRTEAVARGVDPETGALIVADRAAPAGNRSVHAGELVHLRLAAVGAQDGV